MKQVETQHTENSTESTGSETSPEVSVLGCAQRLMDVVPHVMQALREEMRDHRTSEFSVPEFRTLSYIERHHGTSLTEITEHIGLSKPSLSKIVARLEYKGLVRRGVASGDKRRHTLGLTAHGRRTLEHTEAATLRSVAGRLTQLSPQDLRLVMQALVLLEAPFMS